jgi:hypothetical protein
MATLQENSKRYFEIQKTLDASPDTLSKEERMSLLRESIQLSDSMGFDSRGLKDRLLWLRKSHQQQRSEISSYWQPE